MLITLTPEDVRYSDFRGGDQLSETPGGGKSPEMTNVHVQGLFMVVALDPLPFELL